MLENVVKHFLRLDNAFVASYLSKVGEDETEVFGNEVAAEICL